MGLGCGMVLELYGTLIIYVILVVDLCVFGKSTSYKLF